VDFFFGVESVPANIMDAFNCGGELKPPAVPKEAPDLKKVRSMRGEDGGYGGIGRNVIELSRAADIVFMAMHGEPGETARFRQCLI
jgi:D-alanine-D-alanine ligase